MRLIIDNELGYRIIKIHVAC
uniref:Uncharacterized protein n=1 Tax=Rhizophora mucronata TaxID=61149 RepID=A0A2P2PX89_RHIMU